MKFQKYLYFPNKRYLFQEPQPLWKFQLLSFRHFFKCLALGELLKFQCLLWGEHGFFLEPYNVSRGKKLIDKNT